MSRPPSSSTGRGYLLAGALASGLALPTRALAHPGLPPEPHEFWEEWTLDPWVLLPLVLTAGLYLGGLLRLWRRAGTGRGLRRWQAVAFASGVGSLVLALVSPLHRMGEALFSAHMTQHSVLLLVAAPLLVLGRPLIAFVWALPLAWRRRVGRWTRRAPVRLAWQALSGPVGAWLLHAVALWLWHAPSLYQATLGDELVHAIQHTCFLATALLFWHVVERALRHGRTAGVGGLYVFTTAAHAGLLGALLTFAPAPLYPAYAGRTESWGLGLLEDQQIGGMIMWVPGGVIYVVAALVLFARWLQRLEREGGPDWRPAGREGRGNGS